MPEVVSLFPQSALSLVASPPKPYPQLYPPVGPAKDVLSNFCRRGPSLAARLHFLTQVRLVLLYDEIGRSGRYLVRDHLEQWMQLLFAHDARKVKYHAITVRQYTVVVFLPFSF